MKNTESQTIKVGDVIPVGEFFWIENLIGFSEHFRHGHNTRDSGSVDTDCHVKILGFEGESAVVELKRRKIPYGAQSAIGSVFLVSLAQVNSWTEKIQRLEAREERREELREKYVK